MNSNHHAVAEHFEERAPEVKATYAAILKAAKKPGPVSEEAKKTSIHLVRKNAFTGVATRKTALVLTLKSDSDVANKRILSKAPMPGSSRLPASWSQSISILPLHLIEAGSQTRDTE